MRKNNWNKIKTIFLLLFIVVLMERIEGVSWWGFVLPVLALGMVIALAKWDLPFFFIGFLGGFILWIGANLYFHFSFKGHILTQLQPAARIIVLFVSGIVGGLLTGLALYTGKSIVFFIKSMLRV